MAETPNFNAQGSTGLLPQATPSSTVQPGYQPVTSELLKQRHAETANKLVFWLLGILVGFVVLHYGCLLLFVFYKRDDGIKILEDVFHSWLPVMAGLLGAAATFYFTKDGK